MAIIDPWNVPININQQEYAIKGNMIKYQITMSDLELMKIDPNIFNFDIKRQLMMGLLDEIMKTKSVEFTKMEDPLRGASYFRARMFVVPDDMVRILRVSQINNIPT